MTTKFACDLGCSPCPFIHTWALGIGSGRATRVLRADWQKDIDRCAQVSDLKKASEPVWQSLETQVRDGKLHFKVTLHPRSVRAIELQRSGSLQ